MGGRPAAADAAPAGRRPSRGAGRRRWRAGCPSPRRSAPGIAAPRRSRASRPGARPASISSRAARFSRAMRAPVPAALPGARHLRRIAVGHEPEHHRVHRVDVRAERAGEPDAVDGLDAERVHQQPAARVERALGELDLTHVVLGDHEPRSAGRVVQHVGEGALVRDDHAALRDAERAVDDPVGRDHAGEEQLRDRLDDAAARDAGDRRSRRIPARRSTGRRRSPGSAARASPGRCGRARSHRAPRADRRRSARPRTPGPSDSTQRAADRGCRARSRRSCRRRRSGSPSPDRAAPRSGSRRRCRRRRARRCTAARRRAPRRSWRSARARAPCDARPRRSTSANGAPPSSVGSRPRNRWCMIGLPTIVSSSTSFASAPAAAQSSAISPSTQVRIAAVSSASEPGCIIT